MVTELVIDLEIDGHDLEDELAVLPMIVARYALIVANARRDLDLAKEELELVKAELGKEVRTNPESFGLSKVTEAGVESAVIAASEYREAYSRYIDLRYDFEASSAALKAIEAKRDALLALSRLRGDSLYMAPHTQKVVDWSNYATQLKDALSKSVAQRIRVGGG
ncbi:MAG: hypothetical protein QXT45_04690 [Candidatus Bilamarchaeaceae archaeon]